MHSVNGLFVTNRGSTEFHGDGRRSVVTAENKGRRRQFTEMSKGGDEFLLTTVIGRGITLLPSFQVRSSNSVKEECVARKENPVKQKAHAAHRMTGRVDALPLALSSTLSSYHTVSNGDHFVVTERQDLQLSSHSQETGNLQTHFLRLFNVVSDHVCVRSMDMHRNNTDQ